MGYIGKEEYGKQVEQALRFLGGAYSDVIKMLEKKMYDASHDMNYEKAAEYRDLITSVKSVAQKQKITSEEGLDRYLIAYAAD